MVKIELSEAKGIVQKAGSGVNFLNQTVQGASQHVIKLTGAGATRQLSAEDSHAVVIWAGSNASTCTLPALQEGLRYTFFSATAHAHVLNGGVSKLQGSVIHNTNGTTLARQAVSNRTSITMHASNGAVGDFVECWCDGTNWYVQARTNNAVTLA
tara:strand:- start:38 stop:502 length:465 start_codon:yes stop_codon:yes gene_type:complete